MSETGPGGELLLTYYGDDFSGSTDVLEAFSSHGLPGVLFLQPPSDSQLAKFPGSRAVGIAGTSRSRSPAWMDEHLPPVFERLRALEAPLCHYKVCSTFDSSPEAGSIGRAIDIGQRVFQNRWVPLVVGAPALGRYTVFGNLFATVDGVAYRLDRHPTMKRHPVTPMTESDLRIHLGRQTDKRAGLVDILALQGPDSASRLDAEIAGGAEVVLFDTLDEQSLTEAGRLVWTGREQPAAFVAGSSGLEYALIAYWRAEGLLGEAPAPPPLPEAERLVVVSGSCSPVTAQQIRCAQERGFAAVRLDPAAAAGESVGAAVAEAVERGLSFLQAGRSVVVFTALGPEDVLEKERLGGAAAAAEFNEKLGERLGAVLRELLLRSGVRRAVAAGGDTAGRVSRRLGLYALTFLRPFAPGSPLCRGFSEEPALDGLEVLFKGGQVGGPSLFEEIRRGELFVRGSRQAGKESGA